MDPTINSRYSQKSRHNTEEDAAFSLIHKKNARTKEGRRKRLESEIGGVFVVFVGGRIYEPFSGGHFCDF